MNKTIDVHKGCYFVIINKENKIVSYDGVHSLPSKVSKALELHKRLGFYNKDLSYKCLTIHENTEIPWVTPGSSALPDLKDTFKKKDNIPWTKERYDNLIKSATEIFNQ